MLCCAGKFVFANYIVLILFTKLKFWQKCKKNFLKCVFLLAKHKKIIYIKQVLTRRGVRDGLRSTIGNRVYSKGTGSSNLPFSARNFFIKALCFSHRAFFIGKISFFGVSSFRFHSCLSVYIRQKKWVKKIKSNCLKGAYSFMSRNG